MKRAGTIFSTFLLTIISGVLIAQIPPGYYDAAAGKSGVQLKEALYNIIKGHTVLSYSSLENYMDNSDAKSDGTVWDMYSDKPGQTPPYTYTFAAGDQCGNYSAEGDCWNKEHSMPKSWFNDVAPMNSDLFHLYPTDGWVNNKRSNYPYGEVGTASWTSLNGSKLGNCNLAGYSGVVFEPIDGYKGDLARTYFYMVTRYHDIVASWETLTTFGDAMLDGTQYPCFEPWTLTMLLNWHHNDPVSQKEINRNDSVYVFQHNRNPFIDHPEWVDLVWNPSSTEVLSVNPSIRLSPNPCSEKIQISGVELNDMVEIFTITGVKIYSQIAAKNILDISTLQIPKGVYILNITNAKQKSTFRIIRN